MSPEKIARRNFWFMLLEGSMFYVGFSLIQTDTVVAKFLDFTSHSTVLVGLAATISSSMFLVGQVFSGMFIHRVRVQSRAMARMGLASRLAIPLMALLLALGVRGTAAAWSFLLLFSLFLLTDGFVGLCWTQICARTLPVRKRGEVLGLQQTVCGTLGIFTGFFLQRLLASSMEEYRKFALIFACSGAALLISVVLLALIRDVPHPSHPEQPVKTPLRYFRELIPLFAAHPGMRQVTWSRCLHAVSLMALPLNFKFGQMNGLTDYQLSLLVYMPVAGRILSGIFWSQLTRLKGYPPAMLSSHVIGLLSALCNLAAFAMAAAGRPVMLPLSAAMVLLSVNSQGSAGFTQHMISIVGEEERAGYIVLLALIVAPMALSSTLAGFIADRAGFLPVYLMVAAASLAGVWQTWRFFFSRRSPLPPEQRNGAQ